MRKQTFGCVEWSNNRSAESRKGFSSRFMQTLLDFAKNVAKSEIVSLEVRSDNIGAIKLYKKHGHP
ncbi:MAG: GNAT family N-acetyltransferase [Spirochaetales bacterium]|nr:GNAT family N-acetyltransferase [Spirochaetales bacterium]